VVNLVSASVDGLDPDRVTVADSTGRVLSSPTGTAGSAQTQDQQVTDFQNRVTAQVQSMLDRIVGPGNSTVQVTPVLNFDKTVSETTRYFGNADKALSATRTSEQLVGSDGTSTPGGVVGPDGQMDATTSTDPSGQQYKKTSETSDNAIDREIEHREAAPGSVESLHVGVVLDTQALNGRDPAALQQSIASALGIDTARGDTIDVTDMAFDRTAETAAAQELQASESAAKKAQTMSLIRNGGLAGLLVLVALVAWLQARRRAKARAQATSYVVEQLRRDALDRQTAQAAVEQSPAMLALEAAESDAATDVRDEIAALVERQPEDVAALLRGWLVER
jgi:flagellar M-ring protein FliF